MPDPFDSTYKQVANGTAKIDNKGNFTISFIPERPETSDKRPAFQSYEVTATLTDSKGETQEASYTFSVGDTGILLDIQMPGQEMENDSAKAVVTAYTVNRQKHLRKEVTRFIHCRTKSQKRICSVQTGTKSINW